MADRLRERPFDNFRVAITDPDFFVGRSQILALLRRSPFEVRVLLGGRRVGKTSTLRALEWSLLDPSPNSGEPLRAFPVFINMQVEQPEDLGHLRYLLIARLREAFERWKQVPSGTLREKYRRFLQQVASIEISLNFIAQLNVKVGVHNPTLEYRLNHDSFRQAFLKTLDELQDWQFTGVCFLLDETEYIVRQPWADDAWSYFRGLKDTDDALKPFFGFVLAGYRDLKNYQQKIGSDLFNISEVKWLTPLTKKETQALVHYRSINEGVVMTPGGFAAVIKWAGCHPYLTQQMLNVIFDDHLAGQASPQNSLIDHLLHRHHHDFSGWWNADNKTDGFGDAERAVYRAFIAQSSGTSKSLAQCACLSRVATIDALDVLVGTGVVYKVRDEHYTIGAQLFESWVSQQEFH